jgi:SAM-dependent methyltransferase
MAEVDEELESLKERGWRDVAAIDEAFTKSDIDEAGWHRAIADLIVPAYLSGDNPRAQSGHSGSARRWEGARRLLLDAVDRDGSFLDIGCANGHLMECLHRWAAEDGVSLEPWGVEISAGLAELARERLPRWRERIFVANAGEWVPPRRFDYVRTSVGYAPPGRRASLLRHLMEHAVSPGGRLIVGVFNEEVDRRTTRLEAESWGFVVSGETERPHPNTPRLVRRAFWIDVPT